ncbi:MAG: cell division protein FtsZ [Chitinophagaceae bacterium]|nr:cell division protein FtsZ [Chitinophagaceae bacterium]MCZ2395557.1 cell division protein FtsZ [Chitinophagales bacterium]
MIQFDLPKEQSSILKVIGIGGGGGNAVNHMFGQNIEGVNFIICNTDAQALAHSNIPNKIQLGPTLTQGLGAGANPEIGREATRESLDEIRKILEVNTKMAFITAGMGGGTGTGGAPIVAKICKELGILTVGIVTTPFAYEGKKRFAQAMEGIENLKSQVDTLLVISNDKLRHQFGNLTVKAAFNKADNVLATAAKCITDVINSTGQINVDFADVCTVMKNGGVAILGSAEVEGENRAQKAIEQALNSPLLNDNDIRGARWILININSAEGEHEFTMDEVDIIQTYLLSKAGENTDVIMGLGYNNDLQNKIGITLIATGFENKENEGEQQSAKPEKLEPEKEVLELKPMEKKNIVQPLFVFDQEVKEEPKMEVQEVEKPEATGLIKSEIIAALQEESEELIEEELMPEIIGEEAKPEEKEEDAVEEREVLYFELNSEGEISTPIELNLSTNKEDDLLKTEDKSEEKRQDESGQSGSFLAKPAQIYVEERPLKDSIIFENPSAIQSNKTEEDPSDEMQLVEKSSNNTTEPVDEPKVSQTLPIMTSDVEEPPMVDKTDDLRRRATERIEKLRRLSFNVNAADPNNEFETVPAYLRRNLELHNSIANVETFYSNYTVRSDENNQVEISSLNNYLSGKKPD